MRFGHSKPSITHDKDPGPRPTVKDTTADAARVG